MSGTTGTNSSRSSGSVGSAGSGIMTDSSDPTISINPSGGVGTVFSNTTSGETYVCSDDTAGSNVWKNVGEGSGVIEPWLFGGVAYGYLMGGNTPMSDMVEKFSFTSDSNSTDVGNLTQTQYDALGGKSATYVYKAGGRQNGSNTGRLDSIERTSISSGGNAVDVGNMTEQTNRPSGGASAQNFYMMGGESNHVSLWYTTFITKLNFSSQGNATSVGDLVNGSFDGANHTSSNHQYIAGGQTVALSLTTMIQRMSFASEGNAVDSGQDMLGTGSRFFLAYPSSETYGYTMGGYKSPAAWWTNAIQKYQFDTSNNMTIVADLSTSIYPNGTSQGASHSSTTHGYATAGYYARNTITKMPFSTDSTTTDIANILVGRHGFPAGTET